MRESIWGYAVMLLGILAVVIIWFFANVTRTDQHNYNLLKETVESAMLDSVDLAAYRDDGTVKIIEEKFVENFLRRFAENADLSNTYLIEIYDVNEVPPKVSLRVSSVKTTTYNSGTEGEIVTFDIVNNIDAILEETYRDDNQNDILNDFIIENNSSCIYQVTCTKENPCEYTQEYVSSAGTHCNDPKKLAWTIHLQDFNEPTFITNSRQNQNKSTVKYICSDNMESNSICPKNLRYIGRAQAEDLKNYHYHSQEWYKGWTTEDNVFHSFKETATQQEDYYFDIEYTKTLPIKSGTFTLNNARDKINVNVEVGDCRYDQTLLENQKVTASTVFEMTYEYYFE